MDHYSKVDFLKKSLIFEGLTLEQLNLLAPLVREVNLAKGEYLFKEGDPGEPFYLIIESEIEIEKNDPETGKEIHLAVLRPGELFGEMASLSDFHRATSAKALGPVRLLEISQDKISRIPHIHEIDQEIQSKLPSALTQRVKGINASVLEGFKAQGYREKTLNETGRFLVKLLALIFLYFFAMQSMTLFRIPPILKAILIVPTLLLFGAWILCMIQKTHFPWETFGLTSKKWIRSSAESILLTLPVLGLIYLLKGELPFRSLPQLTPFLAGIYFLSAPLQEILYRGALQNTLERFLSGKGKTLRAILIANLPFSLIHLPLSFPLTIAVYALGLFWGWMFLRQKTVVGCAISHLLVGLWSLSLKGIVFF